MMDSIRQCSRCRFLILLTWLLAFTPTFAQTPPPVDLPAGATPGGAKPLIKNLEKKVLPLMPNLDFPDEPADQLKPADNETRIPVSAFVLEGVVDRPQDGIYRKEIEDQLEAFRRTVPVGFTIGDLRNLTAKLSGIYRQAGFILTRVYIPEQDVRDGTVRIKVIEGTLDQVVVEGNLRYQKSLLALPFAGQVNKPVHKERLERALLLLKEYPGLQSSSVLRPGKKVGSTALALKVEKETLFEGIVWLDNYGTELTGEYRGQIGFTVNNPGGSADRISGFIGTGIGGGGDNTFIELGYDRPNINSDYIAGLWVSNNAYTVGGEFEKLDIKGKSTIINAYLLKNFVRYRNKNISGRFDLSHKSASSSLSGNSFSDDSLILLNLGGDLIFRDARWSGHNRIGLQVAYGDTSSNRTGGSGASADGGFSKIILSAIRWQPILLRHPFFRNHFIMLRLHYQFSPDLLTSLEQFSLGGPNSVRAYPISENLVDKGMFLSVEWIAKSTKATKGIFLEGLQFSVFVDYASGELTDALVSEESTVTLKGFGGSVQFTPYGKYFTRFDLALPLGGPDPSNGASIQIFFRLGYLF